MKIIYRVTPKLSQHQFPFFKNKLEMVKTCFSAFKGYHVTVISDGADEWREFLPCNNWIDANHYGNFMTFKTQLEVASSYDDVVLIVEDDYLFRPGSLEVLEKAVKELDFVFPYDHPSHYVEKRFDDFKRMKLVDGNTYRSCLSNTLTFATTGNFIHSYFDILTGHKTNDHDLFCQLSETEILWCPTYSFATHLVKGLLAPNVKWEMFANV